MPFPVNYAHPFVMFLGGPHHMNPTHYTVNYTRNIAGKWVGRLIPQDTPDTTIDTREHDEWSACVDEVFELVEPDAVVHLGDIAGDDFPVMSSVLRGTARNYHDGKGHWS